MYCTYDQVFNGAVAAITTGNGTLAGIFEARGRLGFYIILSEADTANGLTVIGRPVLLTNSDIFLEAGLSTPNLLSVPPGGIAAANAAPGAIFIATESILDTTGTFPLGYMPIGHNKVAIYIKAGVGTTNVGVRIYAAKIQVHPNL
jgi:hypothetical protein